MDLIQYLALELLFILLFSLLLLLIRAELASLQIWNVPSAP